MRRVIKLYPPEWRDRYGAELEDAAAGSPGVRTGLDLVRGAIDAWTRSPGGDYMTDRLTKLAAVLMVLPLFFLGMNLVNEVRGTEGMLFESFFLSGLGTALVATGPVAAVALILLPALRLSRERRPSGPLFGLRLELSRFQLLVLTLALMTAAAFAFYVFVENFATRT